MANHESVQKRLQKVRPPRVQMTYDVEIGDAMESKELPFVTGVLGDFSGDSTAERKRLKDRKFVEVDQGNFDDVLSGIAPELRFRVQDVIGGTDGEMAVQLKFFEMADFRPEAVVRQVGPLRNLLAAREKLADLRNKMSGNDRLEEILSDVLHSTDKMAALAGTLSAKED